MTRKSAVDKKRKGSPLLESNKRTKKVRKSRNDDEVAAEDAIVAIKQNKDGTVTLTMAPGWKKVLPKTSQKDPGCLIMWDDDNILATVNAFNAAMLNPDPNGPAPPEWLHVGEGNQITIPALKRAILTRLQLEAGGGGVVGNCLIAPNSYEEYCRIGHFCCYMAIIPFFVEHAVCPIGRNYVLAEGSKKTTAVASPIPPPPDDIGPGVPVFA